MGITIIVRGSKPRGRTRTSTDRELRDAWGTSSFKSEEDSDKCSFIERQLKEHCGADESRVIAARISEIK